MFSRVLKPLEKGPDCLNTIFTKLPRIEGHFPSEFFFTIYIRKVSTKPQGSVVNIKNKPNVERNNFHVFNQTAVIYN